MAPAGLAFLAATPRAASQRLLPALLRLPLVASGMVEVIGFNGAFQLAMHLIGQSGIPQPLAPTITGSDMHPHLPGNTPGRAREAQQEGRENPVRERPLALGEQRVGEVIEGAPTAVAPVAFAPWPVMIGPPGPNVVTLAPGTLERTIFPPQRMDVSLTLFGVEELVDVREHRHG